MFRDGARAVYEWDKVFFFISWGGGGGGGGELLDK